MKTILLVVLSATICLSSAYSQEGKHPATPPHAKILGPFQLRKQKHPAVYSGLTNTLFASVTDFVGDYRLDFFVGNDHTNFIENDPTITVTPVLGKDEGKMGVLKVSTRKPGQTTYKVIQEDTFKIKAPPLYAVADDYDLEEGDDLFVKAWLGFEGNMIPLPSGLELMPTPGYFVGGTAPKFVKYAGDTVGEGFIFGQRTKKQIAYEVRKRSNVSYDEWGFEFIPVYPQQKVPRDGRDVNVTVTDPFTQQTQSFTVHIMPKRRIVEPDSTK